MKKFSIIVATYNSDQVIETCLNSIVNQIFTDYEIIIIDGNSRDNTLRIVKKFADRIEHLVSEPDKGVYDAWNKGLKLAKGKWIMFVGSDDQLFPDCLQSYVDFIKKNKVNDVDFISSKNIVVNKDDKVLKTIGGEWSWTVFKKYMNIAHVGALHNREYFEKYGVFNPDFKIAGDYELLLRPRSNLKTAFFDKINAKMGFGGVSTGNMNVFKETFIAKNTSGRISYLNCLIDDLIARCKYIYRKRILKHE